MSHAACNGLQTVIAKSGRYNDSVSMSEAPQSLALASSGATDSRD